MHTLTLNINDNVFDKVMNALNSFSNDDIQIQDNSDASYAEKLQETIELKADIEQGLKDYKEGRYCSSKEARQRTLSRLNNEYSMV